MKKILSLAAVAAFVFASCSSLDSKISDYESACKAGDLKKADEIAKDIVDNYKEEDLTKEQLSKLDRAEMECRKNALKGLEE